MGDYTMLIALGALGVFMLVSNNFARKRQTQQRQTEMERMVTGAKVRTAGGFFGTVVEKGDDFLLLKMEPSEVVMKISINSVVQTVSAADDDDDDEYEEDEDDEDEDDDEDDGDE